MQDWTDSLLSATCTWTHDEVRICSEDLFVFSFFSYFSYIHLFSFGFFPLPKGLMKEWLETLMPSQSRSLIFSDSLASLPLIAGLHPDGLSSYVPEEKAITVTKTTSPTTQAGPCFGSAKMANRKFWEQTRAFFLPCYLFLFLFFNLSFASSFSLWAWTELTRSDQFSGSGPFPSPS